jgi:iron complex outermembrane receptor protein
MDALGIPRQQNTTETTPRVALQYQHNDDIQVYASVTKGFKSGGWNARGTTPDRLTPFGPETVTSYELGLKSDWADSRLRLNLTAFYTDVEDFQLPSGFVTPDGEIVFITQNFADLEITGFEAEIVALPVENLTLFASIGIQDGEFQNIDPSIVAQQSTCRETGEQCGMGIVTPTGGISDPVRMPDYTVTVGGNYLISLGGSLNLIPSITYTDTGDHAIGTSNLPGQVDISYSNLNAGLTLENEAGDWSISLDCKNCTDEEQEVSALAGLTYLQEPMRWELRARYNF